MRKLLLISLGATAFIVASPATAKAHAKGLKWGPAPAALPAGAKMAVVSGDPSKEGDFTVRIKVPANYTVAPHHHPTDETVRVLSAGKLTYGAGDKVDTANSATLEKGYHVTMKAGMNHWVQSTDPLEIQVSGTGPFQIVYANPADDPSKAK